MLKTDRNNVVGWKETETTGLQFDGWTELSELFLQLPDQHPVTPKELKATQPCESSSKKANTSKPLQIQTVNLENFRENCDFPAPFSRISDKFRGH